MLPLGGAVERRLPRDPELTPDSPMRPTSHAAAISATPAAPARAFLTMAARTPSVSLSPGEDGAILRLYYVVERDHHLFAHGPLEYSRIVAVDPPHPGGERLDAQARSRRCRNRNSSLGKGRGWTSTFTL